MSYQDILFEKSGQIGIITLNRPERLNAINRPMMTEIYEALGKIDSDPDPGSGITRVVEILSGDVILTLDGGVLPHIGLDL